MLETPPFILIKKNTLYIINFNQTKNEKVNYFYFALLCVSYLGVNAQSFSKNGDSYRIFGIPPTEKTNFKKFERLMYSYRIYQNFAETNTNIDVKFVSGDAVPYGKKSKDGHFRPFSSKKSLRLVQKDIEKCIKSAGNDKLRIYMQWNWFMVQKPFKLSKTDKEMIDSLRIELNKSLL